MYDFNFIESLNSGDYYLKNADIIETSEFEESDLSLYHIKEITFEEKAPRKEAFENVLSAMRIDGINIIYLIRGDKTGVHFYFGVSKNLYENMETPLVLNDIGNDILEPSLRGNFRGCEVEKVCPEKKSSIIKSINEMKHYSVLDGVPGVIQDNENFQGVDRLVDVMLGDEFGIMIIATPLNTEEIKQIESNLYSLHAAIAPLAHLSVQNGTSSGTGSTTNSTKGSSLTSGTNESSSQSSTDGESNTKTFGTNKSTTISQSTTKGVSSSHAETTGENDSWTIGTNKSKSDSIGTNRSYSKNAGNSTGSHSSGSSSSEGSSTSYSKTSGSSNSSTLGKSSSKSDTKGTSESKADSKGTSEGENKSQSNAISHSTGISNSKGSSYSHSENESVSEGISSSESISSNATVDFINKEIQDWIKYIDEVITPRLDYGKGKGIFISSAFLFSNNIASLIKLENTMKSLYAGDKGNRVPLTSFDLQLEALNIYKKFQLPRGNLKPDLIKSEVYNRCNLLSQYISPSNEIVMGNWISTNELGLIAGLPQKEIVGLGLREEVEFGLNIKSEIEECDKLELGNLVQSGRILKNIPIYLDKNALDKHIFIAGVTGSGKTTTCQKLLIQSKLPFLVIEPAKTEYRILTEEYDNLLIFTLGKDSVAPFRLNPFEFYPHESITSHIDMIKASLEASFDMEAAIPQIIEAAIYECYEDCGWNIASNKNFKFNNPFDDGVYSFPTLSDLVEKIDSVVDKQGFDDRLKKDYIGSIKARLQSLLIGSKGMMLNTKRSVNFEKLLESRVILEIEEIRNPAEKSLVMGFILANLNEALKIKFKENIDFKHITLIEEAHRLLSKFTPGDSPNKKQGVEAFADMLAEVRKYGESLIIVDQIPNQLTPEVLKNTNTKIVHKIFAQDDKDAIGNTIVLTDEQKGFLSNLETGRAVILTQGWSKAMQVQITKITDTTGRLPMDEKQIRSRIVDFYCENYKSGVIQGLENFPNTPSHEDFENFINFTNELSLSKEYVYCINEMQITETLANNIKKGIKEYHYQVEFLAEYIAKNLYNEDVETKKENIISLFNNALEGDYMIKSKIEDVLKQGMKGAK